jgi:hypothetical protein
VVGGEDAMLQRIERFEIGRHGPAQANGGRGLVGHLGAHMRPIAAVVWCVGAVPAWVRIIVLQPGRRMIKSEDIHRFAIRATGVRRPANGEKFKSNFNDLRFF